MDVSSIPAAASNLSQAETAGAIQTAVLKKAIDLQAQGAMQLIQAASQAGSNPPHLGNRIDTRA